MTWRRIGPIVLLTLVGAVVIGKRLWQVQVVEHTLWAQQAARLLHSGVVLPPDRGRILDATGAVVARDLETYRLVLTYREFRRQHPLGQVAHARSALEARAVTLQEADAHLLEWAWDLLHLTPNSLEAFTKGEPFQTESLQVDGVASARDVHRGRRASDVRYYLRELLELSPRQWTSVARNVARADRDRPYLELAAAGLSDPVEPWVLWQRIERRLALATDHLAQLADRMESAGEGGALGYAGLVDELEDARVSVEDDAAAKLFREVFGFEVGRVAPATLFRFFELEWIGRMLAWEPPRLVAWAERRRSVWLEQWLNEYALPSVCADLVLDPTFEPDADDFLDRLAVLFAPEGSVERALERRHFPSWRELPAAAVFSELDGLFRARFPRGREAFGRVVLPILDPQLRALDPPTAQRWLLVDRARNVLPETETYGRELRAALAGQRSEEKLWRIARAMVDDWESGFQATLAYTLEALVREAHPDYELGDDGRLLLERGTMNDVRERLDYFLKDYGTRPKPLQKRALEYEVVHLVTRFQRDYPGIRAAETRVRKYPVLDGFEAPPFGELLGNLSAVGLSELQLQRREAREFRQLFQSAERSREDEHDLLRLLEALWRHDDVRGVAGIEGFFDPELRGQNGFRESWGLKQALAAEPGRRAVTEPVDGRDVHLTLDHRVERAAQRSLAFPAHDPADPKRDESWLRHPVGAIVLVTTDGDVIAAASEPSAASTVDRVDAPPQRRLVLERTLRIPYFQPPGSVFKPFVAAWALDRAGLDPGHAIECTTQADLGWAGFGNVRCHSQYGHGRRNLHQAIACSCNAYFAWLGESLGPDDFVQLAHEFGFYEPTGVRTPPPGAEPGERRTGLREDYRPLLSDNALHRALQQDANRQRAGNGLSVIEVTPMQLARATVGLATGRLPDLRLVDRVGETELPVSPGRRIRLAEQQLERVRTAMFAVSNSREGSAEHALSRREVGVDVAAKTGSADITTAREGAGRTVRKHTWVAGWLPADDPKVTFVVFLHDVSVTSSHSAVYVARQFLTQPETVAWLRAAGIAIDAGFGEESR
ncbi:MAG: penicillin-binding transpeptidase domain-containing protein [Planctomycetota bacterium]